MNGKGEVTNLPCLTYRRTLPGPIEKVWAYLTETRYLPAWFGEDSMIEPRRGGAVWIMGGHVRGLVTQWQPPVRLVYTWNVFRPGDAPDAVSAHPESYPTFELAPHGEGVQLTFRHFPIVAGMVPQTGVGWHSMLDMLAAALRGESVEPREVVMRRNAILYGVDLDAIVQ